jgi:hypothetical protein
MYHYVYKIEIPGTSLFYIGKRSSKLPPEIDPYMGSGTEVLKYKMRVKFILETCSSELEAYSREKAILGDQWKTNDDCINQKPGGKGAPSGKDHHWFGKTSAYKQTGKDHHAFGKTRSKEICDKISAGQQQRDSSTYLRGEDHPGFGKNRPTEVRAKISEKKTGVKLGPQSEDHVRKISEALKSHIRPKVTCEWCNRTMDVNNATRYHGSKCKLFVK